MTLVQNLLRPLSGNKTWFFFSFVFLFISCGSLNLAKREKSTETTSDSKPVEETAKGGGVVIVTDNKANKKKAKTTTVTFMGQKFQAPVSDVAEYKVAVILPFCFGKGGKTNEQLREVSLEYFEGVELALEELTARGVKFHAEVFDTQNDSLTVVQLLKKDYLKTVHLIIGPVFDKEFALVEKHCSVHGIPLVNPLRHYAKTNRTSVPVFNPVSIDSNRHYLAALQLIEKFGSHKFVLFNDNSAAGFETRRAFMRAFEEKKKSLPYVTLETLKSHIDGKTDLIVIAPVKSENTVHHLLNATAGKKNIQVLGLEDWFDFPIIPFTTWEKNNLLFYNNNHIRQDEQEVVAFNEAYKAKFGGVAGRYAYIAFDQTLFFVEALTAFGTNFGEFLHGYTFPMFHNAFQFVRLSNDTYENRHINILRLSEDFELVKIN